MDIDPLPSILTAACTLAAPLRAALASAGCAPAQIVLAALPALGLTSIVALVCSALALVCSAFVSGSEISFFAVTPQQIEELDDSPRSQQIERLVEMPERLLATILICNNLVNVAIVVLTSFALSELFAAMPGWLDFLLQTVILTFLILLFGEILPKLVANSNPMRWARYAAPVIEGLVKVFYPLSSLLVRSTKIMNRVVTRQSRDITADELEHALEITKVDTGQDRRMLEGILRFGDTTASEIMTPRVDVTALYTDMTFTEVLEVVVDRGYSRLPVYGESQDDVKGVLYARDLLPYIPTADGTGAASSADDFDWKQLIRKPYFVPEQRMIDDLLEDFRKLKIHIAIVVDEYGGTQGVVTLEDVLEEIVGDINDEYDDEQKTYRQLPDNTYIFDGKTLLTDFFRVTGLDADDYAPVAEEAETLAGMLLAIKGDFPKEKEPLVYGRCRFLVLDIDHHRIASVRVKVMPEDVGAPATAPKG